jgi:Cd2+/Zn2+-exporting ATPase
VLVVATLVALVPPLVFAQPWTNPFARSGALVAACPCAFVISGPVASICALSYAARQGILVRGGAALESLAQVRAIAFDKTGTLTQGAPVVRDFVMLNGASSQEALAIAAALEAHSEHPLRRAVVNYARQQNAAAPHGKRCRRVGRTWPQRPGEWATLSHRPARTVRWWRASGGR